MGFGVVGAGGEIGYGDARLVDAETGTGAEPVLGQGGRGERQEVKEIKEKDGNGAGDSKQEFLRKRLG